VRTAAQPHSHTRRTCTRHTAHGVVVAWP
jgi:hypothetical protein